MLLLLFVIVVVGWCDRCFRDDGVRCCSWNATVTLKLKRKNREPIIKNRYAILLVGTAGDDMTTRTQD
jgi:hypothetical protein